MDIKQAIAFNLSSSEYLVNGYLADLEPSDLLVRPVPGANHIAWQLGHLIAAERFLVERGLPGVMDALPEGFVERHKKGMANSDNPADFLSKDEYLQLAKKVRANTLRVIAGLSPADFDKPASGGPPFVKTVGDALLFISGHWLMHAGQWAVIRRKLGRAPLF
jgi:DinB family protein